MPFNVQAPCGLSARLNVEEVCAKLRRTWARSGALYDQGALPEVRDKRALVGDGDWVEEPWKNGQVAALAAQSKALMSSVGPSDRLVWALSISPMPKNHGESVGLSLSLGR